MHEWLQALSPSFPEGFKRPFNSTLCPEAWSVTHQLHFWHRLFQSCLSTSSCGGPHSFQAINLSPKLEIFFCCAAIDIKTFHDCIWVSIVQICPLLNKTFRTPLQSVKHQTILISVTEEVVQSSWFTGSCLFLSQLSRLIFNNCTLLVQNLKFYHSKHGTRSEKEWINSYFLEALGVIVIQNKVFYFYPTTFLAHVWPILFSNLQKPFLQICYFHTPSHNCVLDYPFFQFWHFALSLLT